jgi:hypothetical protein
MLPPMGVIDRVAVGVVKCVLLVCSIYIGMAMQQVAYLAAVGLLAYAALRHYCPPMVKRSQTS